MTWFQSLVGAAIVKLRGLFPLPDEFLQVRQRAEVLISAAMSFPEPEKFLMVQAFQMNPRMFDEWKKAFYEDLEDAFKAKTRAEHRRGLRELILGNCESWNLANLYLAADDPERKACALRMLADTIKNRDEAEVELTFVKAGAELSMLILRKLEDEAYHESHGDQYLRAYLDADGLVVKSGLDCMLQKERGEDPQMAAFSFDLARKVTEHLKQEFLSGVGSTYTPSKD